MEHPGPADAATLSADFDRLAVLEDGRWDHNRHYHGWLLRRLPAECRSALDVGCGTGDFAGLLSMPGMTATRPWRRFARPPASCFPAPRSGDVCSGATRWSGAGRAEFAA
jgi:SAM-dependent methyltransferase